MKFFNLLSLFFSDLKRQRKRAMLTILSLAWGTLTIVLLLAIGGGVNRQLMKGTHGLGVGIVILYGGQTQIPYDGLPKGRSIQFVEEDLELLQKRIPQIELISAESDEGSNTIASDTKTVTYQVHGVYPSFEELRSHYPQAGGRFLDDLDMKLKRRVAFLGYEMKQDLFGNDNAIGKIIYINNIPFTVVGVMIEKLQLGWYGGPDRKRVVIPLSTFESMYGSKYIRRIVYKPKSVEYAEMVKDKVYKVLGSKYRFDPKDTQALAMWDVIEEEKGFQKMHIGIEIFEIIIGTLTLVVGGTGVANIMYISVRRRTKEIGIKLAVGAKSIYILAQFLLEAFLVVIIGGAIGIGASLLIIQIIMHIPAKGMVWDYLGHPIFNTTIALITSVILGIIGLLAGYFPARRAARLNPIESLKYE